MYELIKITDKSFYIQSPAKIGLVITGDDEVCLIDSGNDKDAGRKVRQILDRNGRKLHAIYNTHSNADHIGGNAYLQKQTGCKIYAPKIECAFTNYPTLEPSFLYGGFPPKALRGKFLMAQESVCENLSESVIPEGFKIIDLQGHFFDMVGFRTPDDVVYLADCLSSKETIEKYGISFVYDVEKYIETLKKVEKMSARMFVPAHAEATENIAPLARYNIETVEKICETIISLIKEPMTKDELLRELFKIYGLKMTFEQYALVGSTVKSYLSYLLDKGLVQAIFDDERLLFKKA